MNRRIALTAAALLAATIGAHRADSPAPAPAWTRGGEQADRLSLEAARAYMVTLINQDRASKGLSPVALDPVATSAGQKHAEEMAANRYLAHWNREGKLPDQRYTEAGGKDYVRENVYLTIRYSGSDPSGPFKLDTAPAFTERELREIEAAYFNEQPPYDGHRKNILEPRHTHVGVALARAHYADRAAVLVNTQEFVGRYAEMDPLPTQAKLGESVTVSGKLLPGIKLRAITLARGPLPKAMGRDELQRTRTYAPPPPFAAWSTADSDPSHAIRLLDGGRFQAQLRLADEGRPGIYYVAVWARDDTANGREFLISQRTVTVLPD